MASMVLASRLWYTSYLTKSMVNNTAKGRLQEVAMSYTANLLAGMYNNKF